MSTNVPLRCNNVRCRVPLTPDVSQAVVTSYIFCKQCASTAFKVALVCPACYSSLHENENIMVVSLNQTEAYKSMVLAGQGPEVIIEIASRSLAFWVYQVSQELTFQDIMVKKITTKSNKIEAKATMIIKDWQTKNKRKSLLLVSPINLKDNLKTLRSEYESEKKKSYNLELQLQEKSRHMKKLQSTSNHNMQRQIISRLDIPGQTMDKNVGHNIGKSSMLNGIQAFKSPYLENNQLHRVYSRGSDSVRYPTPFNNKNEVQYKYPTPPGNSLPRPSPIMKSRGSISIGENNHIGANNVYDTLRRVEQQNYKLSWNQRGEAPLFHKYMYDYFNV
ncbi:hypothetical protein BB559_003870 [Furculomyces boomerangus]|uniref:Uncharacterized protein n=2 Tax=Harpellales TaxID=61421 RepID=A0A2T9YIB4_9FUNG|nr:hypothetical protein BB559_003870 [Furculomyces boomerangus]PWA01546.1 hypothetical protein BB558_002361 [Smittium angustum]